MTDISLPIAPLKAPVDARAWDNGRLADYCRRLRAQYPIDEREGRILFVQIPQDRRAHV